MPKPPLSAHARGLGHHHRVQRARLLARLTDGTPCPCDQTCGPSCPCRQAGHPPGGGLPMYRDPRRNVDGLPLEADHSIPRSRGGTIADRLMIATCNRSRQAGTRWTEPEPRHDVNSRRW